MVFKPKQPLNETEWMPLNLRVLFFKDMIVLPKPKNNRQEVLLTLIKKGKVSIEDYPYLSGFRTRVSELVNDYGLTLKSIPTNSKNKFGRTITFMEHHLEEIHIEKAISIYNSINKQ